MSLKKNGKLFVNVMEGTLKLVKNNRRVVFPIEVVDGDQSFTKRIQNSVELLSTIGTLKRKRRSLINARQLLIEYKINSLLHGSLKI